MTRQEMLEIIETMSEGDGFTFLYHLSNKFSWSGTMFCPDDVMAHISSCHEADGLPEPSDDEMDKMTQSIVDSWEYRKGLKDGLTEQGYELIGMAYEDMMHQIREAKEKS